MVYCRFSLPRLKFRFDHKIYRAFKKWTLNSHKNCTLSLRRCLRFLAVQLLYVTITVKKLDEYIPVNIKL